MNTDLFEKNYSLKNIYKQDLALNNHQELICH